MHITQFTERKITKIMRKRIGNDFLFYWIIKENNVIINPDAVIDFKITIRHRRTGSEIVAEFDVVNSSPSIKCENLLYLGIYDLIATWKTVDYSFEDDFRDSSADVQAFEIVSSSSSECETDLTVTSEIAIGFEGADAFEVWLKNGNGGKTYEDYIAFLREPMTLAIEEGEQTAAEWAIAENARKEDELIRKDDEEDRRAAEVIREQVKDATIIAKDEAIQATSDANNAASLAGIQGDYANTKGNLADAKAEEARLATIAANEAAFLANSTKGWTPLFTDEADGTRIIRKLSDYFGGTGAKPTLNVGLYLKSDGTYTATKAQAVDYKGATGEVTTLQLNAALALKADKSSITDYIVLYQRKIATVVNGVITAIQDTIDAHNSRVTADSGAIRTQSLVKRYYDICYDNNMFDSIKFAWLGDGGSKFRTSGINTFFTKIYSMLGGNDASQVTSTLQPYLSGNIAPNERYGLKNPNGGGNFMTHPTISFGANESWSVTTVLNSSNDIYSGYCGNSIPATFSTRLLINSKTKQLSIYSESAFVDTNIDCLSGKNTTVTLVGNGNNTISIYVNSIFRQTVSIVGTYVFSQVLRGSTGSSFQGKINSHIIRSQALTPTQVTAEYNLLRSYIPEIENVVIGTQTWATSNCEMVATPQGNVIAEMQANVNVEKITNIADREFSSDTGFWGKDDASITISGGSAHYINTPNMKVLYKFAFLIIGKSYKITYTVRNYVSGSVYPKTGGSVSLVKNANGTYTDYIIAQNTFFYMSSGANGTSLDLDDISIQEIGWSGSQELYDGIYAQTTGTVEQKTYAAVKAAAMWSHYNNDVALGAIYGKLYNWFAVKLLQMDIDYYNAANPTTPWGWRVPTSTDFTTLSTYLGGDAVAGGKLKLAGTTYWGSPNTGADNSSGFSAIGGGMRDENGSYSLNRGYSINFGVDSYVLLVSFESSNLNVNNYTALIKRGLPIRLIKS